MYISSFNLAVNGEFSGNYNLKGTNHNPMCGSLESETF